MLQKAIQYIIMQNCSEQGERNHGKNKNSNSNSNIVYSNNSYYYYCYLGELGWIRR
jgi:hypothetical protein